MALETATYISDLVTTNPTSTDPKSQGDDHIRLVKAALKTTLPNITGSVSATHTELNYSSGVTSAIQTQINAKAPIASPTFTGTVTVPTPVNSTDASTKGYVDSTAFSSALPAQTGNSGKFVTTNGTTASWSTVEKIPSAAVITSTTTWTCPANVTKAKVYVTGGGGSAGSGYVSQAGGGGGGGGTAIKFLTVTPGTVYTATIGAGGTALINGSSGISGNAGGTTTFSGSDITTISANGGAGGQANAIGGTGGNIFSGHDLAIGGGNGTAAPSNSSSPPPLGGSSFWGGLSPEAIAGVRWGNGGGGKYGATGGPAGASGVVVIEY